MRLAIASAAVALAALSAGCKEGGTINVHSLSFKGVQAVDEGRLKDALATHQSSKIPWGKKSFFDRSRFDADLKRIQAFYADRGFPDARVTGFDVKLNDKQDEVDLTVTIAEGEPVVVKSIAFSGFDVVPAAHLDDLKNRLPVKVGQPRDRQLVVSAHEMAVNELKDHGFPYGKVSTAEDDGSDGKQAVLTFTAEPGLLAHFGKVEVVGNKSVDEHIIRRQLTFKPGELYQRNLVQDSQRRLYGLELFQFANVESLNQEQQPEEVPVRVTVAEGNHQRVNFGVGYGTEEKARVDAEYHHVNFLGGARTAGAHVRWSSLDRGIRLDFNQPYFMSPHFSLGAEGQQWYTYTPAYTRGDVRRKADADAQIERADIVGRIDHERARRQLDHGRGLQRSHASQLLHRARSRSHDEGAERHAQRAGRRFPALDGRQPPERAPRVPDRSARRGSGPRRAWQFQLLRRIGGRPAVPAARGQPRPREPRCRPATSGRAMTIRRTCRSGRSTSSAARRASADGDATRSARSCRARRWAATACSRSAKSCVPCCTATSALWRSSTGAMSGPGRYGFDLHDLRYAIGAGLRYQTPVGPIRFDYGYQLNPIPDLLVNGAPQTRRYRLHFSIGQAF